MLEALLVSLPLEDGYTYLPKLFRIMARWLIYELARGDHVATLKLALGRR